MEKGNERMVAYHSKFLTPCERNYCATRKEPVAVIQAVKHFRPYLYQREFKIRTDHASMLWLCWHKEPTSQVAIWLEILSEYQFKIEDRPGHKHGNARGLSRKCPSDCKQCTKIQQGDGGPDVDEVHQGLTPENLQGEPVPSPVLPKKADEDDLWIDLVHSINIQMKDRDRDLRRMQSSGLSFGDNQPVTLSVMLVMHIATNENSLNS